MAASGDDIGGGREDEEDEDEEDEEDEDEEDEGGADASAGELVAPKGARFVEANIFSTAHVKVKSGKRICQLPSLSLSAPQNALYIATAH